MKTRLTLAALCAAALTFALPNFLFSQIYIPSGGPLFNTGGDNVGIGIAAPTGKLEVQAGAFTPAVLQLQTIQSTVPGEGEGTFFGEPNFAFRIMRNANGLNNATFTIDPTGRTTIGTFPAAAPDLLAVGGSIGLFNTPTNFARIRCTSGLGTEIIWSNSNNRNLSFKNEQTGLVGMLLTPGGKFAVGSTVLDGDHRLRAKGSAVAEVLQVQVEGNWGTNNNTLGLSTVDGNHIYWRTPDQQIEFRSEGNTPLVLHSSGKVGINTDSMPGNHSLYIKGSMIMEEGFVKVMGQWPDYVFQPGYTLMPLTEVSSYINRHGRLPGMPSAAQVAEEGVALGETQRLLTEKVEELTLYLLELSSRLRSMTDQYETMTEEMEALREEITTLRGEK